MNADLSTAGLLTAIGGDDANVRTQAWLRAGEAGPGALKPLAQIAADGPLEISRAAWRAMWRIARDAGAPGSSDRETTTAALLELLGDEQPTAVRREALWMLSELADGRQAAERIARLLNHKELGEDSRMVLERLPGEESTQALQAAFRDAPEEAKFALAHSLRKCGVQMEDYPTGKLTPAKESR